MKLKYNDLVFDLNGDVNLDNYYTKSECDNKYALKSHSHNISDITNLQSQLNNKAASNHTHSQYATTSAVTNAQNTANNALNVANSKIGFANSSSFIHMNNGRVTATKNALLAYIEPNNYTFYVNGVNISIFRLNYAGASDMVQASGNFGMVTAGTTVTCSRSMFSGNIGVYFG